MALNITVIIGSVRTERIGPALAKLVVRELEALGADVHLADPKELDFPLIDYRYHEMEAKGMLTERQKAFGEQLRACDGVVFVSPEYNHGIPAGMKNIIDVCGNEMKWKMAGIACYSAGIYGGARASTQFRVTLGALMPTQPLMMNVPQLASAVDEDGNAISEMVGKTAKAFCANLLWWADAIAAKKAKDGLPQ